MEMKNKAVQEAETVYSKKKTGVLWLIAGLLAYLSVWSLPRILHLKGDKLAYTNSIFSVFLFIACSLFFYRILALFPVGKRGGWHPAFCRKDLCREKHSWYLPGLMGTLFSVCMVFGGKLDREGSVPFTSLSMWMVILILAVLSALAVRYLWERLAGLQKMQRFMQPPDREIAEGNGRIFALVVFLLYLPVFWAVYPGFFVYDAQEELMQVITRNFSTHHPLVHVLLLGGIVQVVYKLTGSYNMGIACYTLLQMTVMSGIFGWCVERCRRKGLGKRGCYVLSAYFGLFPVLVMFSLCSAKDGLFTGMLLILTIQLQQLCTQPEDFFGFFGNTVLLGTAALGMMLLRHNGVYALLVFAAILVIFVCRRRKEEKQEGTFGIWSSKGKVLLLCLAAAIAVYVTGNAALTAFFRADDSEHQEMLTVPISQLARVYAYEKDVLPAQEKEILYRYLPEEVLARYTPKVTDGVKVGFDNEAYQKDAGSFLRLWAKWGREHPFAYLNAWLMTSYGFWYPDTVIDVYRGNTVFTYTYEDSSYFGYEVEQPGIRESKLPWLDELYRRMSLEITQQKIPVVSMLFSPGFLFWAMIFGLGYLGYMGRWRQVLPYGCALLVWLTFLLGPTYLVRYVVFLWVLVPLLFLDIFRVKFD